MLSFINMKNIFYNDLKKKKLKNVKAFFLILKFKYSNFVKLGNNDV
jgi:hypothetical protein